MDQIKSSLGRLWEISWETTMIYCTGSTSERLMCNEKSFPKLRPCSDTKLFFSPSSLPKYKTEFMETKQEEKNPKSMQQEISFITQSYFLLHI